MTIFFSMYKWNKKKVENLKLFLSKTYNATEMEIRISHPDVSCVVPAYFQNPKLSSDYLSRIRIKYDSDKQTLCTDVMSDEFLEDAKTYCTDSYPFRKILIELDKISSLFITLNANPA